jgi:hypothetical protein
MTPKPISPEVAAQTTRELETVIAKHDAIEMIWSDLLGKLRTTDADLFARQAALV